MKTPVELFSWRVPECICYEMSMHFIPIMLLNLNEQEMGFVIFALNEHILS